MLCVIDAVGVGAHSVMQAWHSDWESHSKHLDGVLQDAIHRLGVIKQKMCVSRNWISNHFALQTHLP